MPTPDSRDFEFMQLSLFGEAMALPPCAPAVPRGANPGLVDSGVGRRAVPPAPRQRIESVVPAAAAASPLAPPETHLPSLLRHPRAERELRLNGHTVGYAFRRARRRSIGFVVSAEGLAVSAPRWVTVAEVESVLQEKSGWILRKLQEQQERAQRLRSQRVEWRDGTTIPFLGETVIVVLDPRATGAVLHTDASTLPGVPRLTLHVGLPHGASAQQIRDAVQSWLQRQARRVFEERCAHFSRQLGVRMKRLSLSSAATRWGSANADGSIRLNWRLIHFALPTIDYVVAHELAHLREMNHSAAFWEVVRSVVPDYEASRGRLSDDVLPVFD